MARVKIYENDLTGNVFNEEYSDIAFVPGFSLVDDTDGDRDKPVLCYDETTFTKLFGTTIPSNKCSDMEPDLDENGNIQFLDAYDESCCSPVAYRKVDNTYYPVYAMTIDGEVVCYADNTYTTVIDKPSELYFLKVVSAELTDEEDRIAINTNIAGAKELLLAFVGVAIESTSESSRTIIQSKTSVKFNEQDVYLRNLSSSTEGEEYSGSLYQLVKKEVVSEITYYPVIDEFNDPEKLYVNITLSDAGVITEINYLCTYNGLKDRCYYRYMGIKENSTGKVNEFNEIKKNTVSISTSSTDVAEEAYQHKCIPDQTTITIYDKGYVYARELLYQGLPVYYWQVNRKVNDDEIAEDLTYLNYDGATVIKSYKYSDIANTGRYGEAQLFVQEIYDLFASDNFKAVMKDRGGYDFKYLTTGGYPIFLVTNDEHTVTLEDGSSITTKITQESYNLINDLLEIVRPRVEATKYAADDDNFAYNPKYTDDNPGFKDYPTCMNIDLTGRGDCILLIDHENKPEYKTLTLRNDVQDLGSLFTSAGLEYCSMFTPWCNFTKTFEESIKSSRAGNIDMPGSFAYMTCLAQSLKNYANWNAISGVVRGKVQNLKGGLLTGHNALTNTIANACQADPEEGVEGTISINCITEIRPYGNIIWGNRTMQPVDDYKGVTAMGFLNLRNMVSDIKKMFYRISRKYMFEQNGSVLWVNFKADAMKYLDKLKDGYGIQKYELTKGALTAKHKLYAELKIWPIYAVEYIQIDIDILDEDVEVTEGEE